MAIYDYETTKRQLDSSQGGADDGRRPLRNMTDIIR